MSSAEIEAGLAAEPEDELVQVEIEDAKRKKKTGKGRTIAIVVSVVVIAGVFAFALPKIANTTFGRVKGCKGILALLGTVLQQTPPTGRRAGGAARPRTCMHADVAYATGAMVARGAAVGMASSFAMLKAWVTPPRRPRWS
jgi:hypothetical protein